MIFNLTSKTIHNRSDFGETVFETTGYAQAEVNRVLTGTQDNCNLYENVYGNITGLPEYVPGKYYIVEKYIVDAAKQHGRKTCDLITVEKYSYEDKANLYGVEEFHQN